jgi:hypothetical protein
MHTQEAKTAKFWSNLILDENKYLLQMKGVTDDV